MSVFTLHTQLEADSLLLGHFPLCQLRLINDANYPWFLLVPQRAEITEIHQLEKVEQQQLMRESSYLSELLTKAFNPDKLNIAALGNQVPQLHIHHIARYRNDPAWPAPVWGHTIATPYQDSEISAIRQQIQLPADSGFLKVTL